MSKSSNSSVGFFFINLVSSFENLDDLSCVFQTQLQFHLSSAAGSSHLAYPATASLVKMAVEKMKKSSTIKNKELVILTAFSAAHQAPTGQNAEDIKSERARGLIQTLSFENNNERKRETKVVVSLRTAKVSAGRVPQG